MDEATRQGIIEELALCQEWLWKDATDERMNAKRNGLLDLVDRLGGDRTSIRQESFELARDHEKMVALKFETVEATRQRYYAMRVRALEEEGLSTSDAQAVLDAKEL